MQWLFEQWLFEQAASTQFQVVVQLQRALGMPLAQLWLALLLSRYHLEQRGDFYETGRVWIVGQR